MLVPLEDLDGSGPRRIGPYRLLGWLGAGGMGEVYLAEPDPPAAGTPHAPLIAVKTIRHDLAVDQELRNRFRREIATAAAVDSARVAHLVGSDPDAERPWLATEYIVGPALDRAVREGGAPLPVPAVLALAADLAGALRDIHRTGLLHRDLKPSNVLLDAGGARVIDFGIARSHGATTLTATGAMLGSPGFMSPEHVLGAQHIVAASDVFAMGAVLCFAATGSNPFGEGPVAAVLYRMARAEADLSAVPGELRGLLAACLRAEPEARPGAEELAAGLQADDPGRLARPAPWPGAVRELIGRHRAEAERAAALASRSAAPLPIAPLPAAALPASGEPADEPAAASTGRRHHPPTPVRGRRSSRGGRRKVLLAGAAFAVVAATAAVAYRTDSLGFGDDGRNEATAGGPAVPSKAAPSDAAHAAGPPEGWKPWSRYLADQPADCAAGGPGSGGAGSKTQVLACRLVDGSLQVLDAATGRERWRARVAPGEEHGVSEPSTSARGGLAVPGLGTAPVVNGDTLITVEQNLLRVRDLTSGKVRWERKADAGREFVQAPTSAGDQVYAVATGEGQQAVAYSLADGKRQWTRALGQGTGIEGLQVPYKVLGLAGKTLVVNSESGLQSLDPGSGRPLGTFDRTGGNDSFDQETCSNVVLQPTYVLCHRSGIDSGKPSVTWQLKPRTLKPVRELSRTNPELRASDTLLRDGDSAVLIGRQLNQDRVFAVDLTTGKTRWTGTMVSQNAEESPAVPMAGPLLLGGQAVEATDRHLVTLSVKGSGGGGSPASVRKAAEQPLDKPADGSPGRWARSVAVESARRPALLSLPGVLFAIGGDGAVRSIKPPG